MKTAGIISIIVVILVIGLIGLILFNNINNSNIENPNTDNSNEVNDISGSTNEVDDFSGGQINDANNNPKTYTINIENYDYKPKTLEINQKDCRFMLLMCIRSDDSVARESGIRVEIAPTIFPMLAVSRLAIGD